MGISREMLMCEDMTCTDVARRHDLARRHATVLPSNSYYIVVASIFLISTASCKESSIFRLFSAILAEVTRPSNPTSA